MNNQQKHFENLIDAHTELYEAIYEVVSRMCELGNYSKPRYDLRDCKITVSDIANRKITVEWEEWSGEWQGRTITFPIEYLWENEWERKEQQKRLEANLKAIADRKAKEEKAKRETDLRDYQQYLNLRERFGDVDPFAKTNDNIKTGKYRDGLIP